MSNLGTTANRIQPFMFLRVVDRMSFQPMLVSNFADPGHCGASGTRNEEAVLPNQTRCQAE
jgi:hypothetical protein